MYQRFLLLPRSLVLVVACTGILLSSISGIPPLGCKEAFAADQVVLKYLVVRQSLSVKELSTFAETGKMSRPLQVTLKLARQDPETVRRFLTQPVSVNLVFLDRLLNSPVGNVILDQISQFIHTPSHIADRQALRAALVLSASRDNSISLIETIQNYSTPQVEVEGERLESAYRQLLQLRGRWQDLLGPLLKG